jgi:hypothetical protein
VLVVVRAAKVELEAIERAVCEVVLVHAPGVWRPALSEGEADDERAMPSRPQSQLLGGFFVLIPVFAGQMVRLQRAVYLHGSLDSEALPQTLQQAVSVENPNAAAQFHFLEALVGA